MNRRQNFMNIAWFWDQYQRKKMELSPPYQRRSVWNQDYKDYFIDTILLGYPSPAIFLYEDVLPSGETTYHVVDGKQRLTTIFDFINNEFAVSDKAEKNSLRGLYFSQFNDDIKKDFWYYQFSVEYLPTTDENIINNIFDRINRNVAKLSAQELRHARFDGVFIQVAEEMAEYMEEKLGDKFPRITLKYKRQMKDVEFVAELLLLLERGPRGYSQLELDEEFSSRDSNWEERQHIEEQFREIIQKIKEILDSQSGDQIIKTRFRNQADFYSLFGSIFELITDGNLPDNNTITHRLLNFIKQIDEDKPLKDVSEYIIAARSASNDPGPRKMRISIVKKIIITAIEE